MPATLTVLYPASEGATFDFDYYNSTHDGLVKQHMSGGLKEFTAVKCLGTAPDMAASPYIVEARFVYETQDDLMAALGAAGDVLADIANFTNVQPTVIIGETL